MTDILLENVWLKYRIEFKENGQTSPEDFLALKGINLKVEKGEAVCIIGENGAGKTSLLKIISGMLKPDRGKVFINGTVSGLMDIGAGFHRDLTGSENIYLISYLSGLNKNQVDARYNDIINFASLGRFINAPVRSYSQGMYMRLGFAIAIHIDPEILVIDDTFAVGDIYTQRKCLNRILQLKEKGKTIVFVTHDLETAKRICSRGVFLRDGQIIKDGPIDKVCSYYAETVGNKRGIAILQEGPLAIVFNNGKLILRWKDATLTPNLAGHSNMLFSGREYLSTTADWRVLRFPMARSIIALGKWPGLSIRQYWKITLSGKKEFLWEIVIRTAQGAAPQKYETRAIFTSGYKNWITLGGEKIFPGDFIHGEQWQCIPIDNPVSKVVGLKDGDTLISPLPAILFDRSEENKHPMSYVGNTGSEIAGRIVQFVVFPQEDQASRALIKKYRCFLSRVMIFDPDEQERLRSYLSGAERLVQESKLMRKWPLSLLCKNRQIDIYWQDKLLSRGAGLNTQFRYKDKDYRALDGNWVIRRENDEEVVITISWSDHPPFRQIWRIRLQSNDSISWHIAMEIDEAIGLRNKQTEMFLCPGYDRWTAYGEGGDFQRSDKNGTATLINYTNRLIGVEGTRKINEVILPEVLLSCEDAAPRASYIFRNKEDALSVRLQYTQIDFKENSSARPGNPEYFKGTIRIFEPQEKDFTKEKRFIIKENKKTAHKIEFNRMSLVFEYGKGRVFWGGVELTKGLGLYSSVFSRGRWQDSSQAFWEIHSQERRLLAFGRWPWVPLTQRWELSLLEEKVISWEIEQELWEAAHLEKEQVSLMVSDRYKEWFSHRENQGRFPERFSSRDGLVWDRLWSGGKDSPIGIKERKVRQGFLHKQFLPSVIFDCLADCLVCYPVIENTDNIFQARVLQYELDSDYRSAYHNNKTQYFTGRIRIIA